MCFIDLHVHSNYSDGSDSVRQILQLAHKNNVAVLSITDHNTLSAYHENSFANEQTAVIFRGRA